MSFTPAVAGLDYSTLAIHIALVRGRDLVSVVQHDLGRDLATQIGVIVGALDKLQEQADHPTTIVMEKVWMDPQRSRGFTRLHEVPVRVETLAIIAGFNVRFVPVNTWKAQVLGHGHASKEASLRAVEMQFGVRLPNANYSDAVCLALWGQAQQRTAGLVEAAT